MPAAPWTTRCSRRPSTPVFPRPVRGYTNPSASSVSPPRGCDPHAASVRRGWQVGHRSAGVRRCPGDGDRRAGDFALRGRVEGPLHIGEGELRVDQVVEGVGRLVALQEVLRLAQVAGFIAVDVLMVNALRVTYPGSKGTVRPGERLPMTR